MSIEEIDTMQQDEVRYYVTTKEVEPMVSLEQKELILKLSIDGKIANRFPFDDAKKNKVQIFMIGTFDECQNHIDNMNPLIKDLFKKEKCTNNCELKI
jgi:hypothetical protein